MDINLMAKQFENNAQHILNRAARTRRYKMSDRYLSQQGNLPGGSGGYDKPSPGGEVDLVVLNMMDVHKGEDLNSHKE